MTIFFFIIVALAVFHFVYEGIIAPSLRLRLRYRLFEQRDHLRHLRRVERHAVDGEVFGILHGRLNNAVRLLPAIHLSTMIETDAVLRQRPELKAEIAHRDAILAACACGEVKGINEKSRELVGEAFAVNTMGWVIYIIPLALLLHVHWFMTRIADLLLMPPKDMDQAISMPKGLVAN